jgi:pimeloyl-ACP methyl ester carboxylesterase
VAGPSDIPFDGVCPWCGTAATLEIDARVISASRRCPCGAIALGAPPHDFDEVLDDARNYFGVHASTQQLNFEPPANWLEAAGVEIVEGGVEYRPVPDAPFPVPPLRYNHYWFRRSSILDAPLLTQRLFFPQPRAPEGVLRLAVPGATLACAARHVDVDAPILVHFHGNGESVADYVPDVAEAYAAEGINTLFVEYRGYGASTGTPGLVRMLADVGRVLAHIAAPPSRVFAYGRSIGSIYAIEAARRLPGLGGLIIESGIADPLERVLVRVSAEELGVDRATLEREVALHLDHQAKLAAYAGRVLVLHARRDHLIDASHAERNARWARRSTLKLFDAGDHNTVVAANLTAIVDTVARFMRQSSP